MLFSHLFRRNIRPQTIQPSISRAIINRSLSSSTALRAETRAAKPSVHGAYYKTHGRALAKSLTLAFLSYQIFYWIWLTLEAEAYKDEKTRTIHGLEEEVRLLSSGQGTHVLEGKKRLLDEDSGR